MSVPANQMMPPGGAKPPQAGPAPPGGSPVGPGGGGPAAATMMSPQMPAGEQEGSRVDIMMATKLLERSLGAFGSASKEGQSILKALSTLGGAFGHSEQKTQELMPAELRHMIAAAAGPGMPSNAPGAGGQPPPGGPPGGMPPGGPPGGAPPG